MTVPDYSSISFPDPPKKKSPSQIPPQRKKKSPSQILLYQRTHLFEKVLFFLRGKANFIDKKPQLVRYNFCHVVGQTKYDDLELK